MQVEAQWRGFECMPSPTAEVGVAAHIALWHQGETRDTLKLSFAFGACLARQKGIEG